MFGSSRKSKSHYTALEQVKNWTRNRFKLSTNAVIIVAELNCQVPGCPPIETVVAFWGDDSTRYRFKIFKPVQQVIDDDLPISWLLPSLIDYDDIGCDCC